MGWVSPAGQTAERRPACWQAALTFCASSLTLPPALLFPADPHFEALEPVVAPLSPRTLELLLIANRIFEDAPSSEASSPASSPTTSIFFSARFSSVHVNDVFEQRSDGGARWQVRASSASGRTAHGHARIPWLRRPCMLGRYLHGFRWLKVGLTRPPAALCKRLARIGG